MAHVVLLTGGSAHAHDFPSTAAAPTRARTSSPMTTEIMMSLRLFLAFCLLSEMNSVISGSLPQNGAACANAGPVSRYPSPSSESRH